jgi:hypothetical protein
LPAGVKYVLSVTEKEKRKRVLFVVAYIIEVGRVMTSLSELLSYFSVIARPA